jgi:hypothetical protein
VCKNPGATLAPPMFQSHPTHSLPMLSTGSGFLADSRKFCPRVPYSVFLLCFSRGNVAALTGHREDLTLPTSKGASTRAAPVYALACLHTLDNPFGFASSSPVALKGRLIRPWTVFPLNVRIVHSAVHLEPFVSATHRQQPVLVRACRDAHDQDDDFLETS